MGLYMKKIVLSIVILICFILVNLFKFNTTYFLIAIFVIELIRLLIRKFKVKLLEKDKEYIQKTIFKFNVR